jgi:hypothetical protein
MQRLPLQNRPGRLESASAAPTVGKVTNLEAMTAHGHLAEVAMLLERFRTTKTLNRHKRENFAAMHRRPHRPMMC